MVWIEEVKRNLGGWENGGVTSSRILWNPAWWLVPAYGCMEIWKGIWTSQDLRIEALEEQCYE